MIDTILEICFYIALFKYYYVYFFDNTEQNHLWLQQQFFNTALLALFIIVSYTKGAKK